MKAFRELEALLSAREKPVKVFFRDDDGGWADDHLQALCEDFTNLELPLDIAVIPDALSDRSIELISRLINSSDRFAIHQHGFTHANHQLQGRSCEFGSDRSYQQQYDDIAAGKKILAAAFGSTVKPIFTPPWNRCNGDTASALHALDIEYLSRIVRSEPIDTAVPEFPVTVDWLKKNKGVALNQAQLIEYICGHFNTGDDVIGIMLHHEHMDQDNRALFGDFVDTLKASQIVSFHSMMSIAQ